MRNLFLMLLTLFCAFGLVQSNTAQTNNVESEKLIFSSKNITSNTLGGGQFYYSNAKTSVFGKFLDGFFGPAQCECLGGTNLFLSSRFAGEGSFMGGNPGLVNEVLYEQIFFSGSLDLSADNYTLPTKYNRSKFSVTVPARLTGVLNLHTESPFVRFTPPIFTTQLNLQGTVTVNLQMVRLAELPGGIKPFYRINYVKYEFSRSQQNLVENDNQSDTSN